MLSILFSIIAIFLLSFMVVKKINAHMALLLSGLFLLAVALCFDMPVFDAKNASKSLNLDIFDIFQIFNLKLSDTLSGLGLTLMTIAGFSAYMEYVGASGALFKVFEKPLNSIKSPYLLLIISYFITQFVVLFIPSHAGLGLLLMATMYPILVRTGVSKLSALTVIGTCQYIDHGPGSGNVNMAANTANIDVANYFIYHQLPTTIPIILVVGITIVLVSKYFDKKDGFKFDKSSVESELNEGKDNKEFKNPPMIYAVLPIIPLVLILSFSKIVGSQIKMNVPVAMIISTFIAIFFEMVRHKSVVQTLNSIMIFFKGMGHLFVITVSLIVCGQVFAEGLVRIGLVETLIGYAKEIGVGFVIITILASIFVSICAFMMGSGNAAFFSFAPLIPNIAKQYGVEIVTMIAPIQIMAGFGRCMSPIAPAILAISSIAKVSPIQVIKRTSIPMLAATIVNIICMFIYM